MEINIPEVQAEVTEAFWQYDRALLENDIDTVINLFWDSPHTLRYSPGELLYGIQEIKDFRQTQRGSPLLREVTKLMVTTFGRDYGTANCETRRTDTGAPGRQSHSWVRLPEGWRIVAAQVSVPLKS
ncbi:MAG: oxalurate catabolism protein HpxZ [Rhodospirillaceae bacterium]|jgi:hypothetical protein|nr:oxalurate catabolism protein HpxZ [Rhodospirillaceae bacterium]